MREKRNRISLKFNSYYEDGVLYHGWNEGLFSCISTSLWNLASLYSEYSIQPNRIDFSGALNRFKTDDQNRNNIDIYSTDLSALA